MLGFPDPTELAQVTQLHIGKFSAAPGSQVAEEERGGDCGFEVQPDSGTCEPWVGDVATFRKAPLQNPQGVGYHWEPYPAPLLHMLVSYSARSWVGLLLTWETELPPDVQLSSSSSHFLP